MTDEQKVQLLPCPFCGGETRTSRHNGDERIGYNITITISCKSCGASLPLVSRHDKNDWCTESAQSVTERAITAWNTRQAALSHASATAEEGSVDDRGIEPDCEALSLMNGGLCKFGTHWGLDGDYLRCRACKRPQIASCAHMDFPHAAWCEVANDVEAHPWLTLIGLLKPIAIDQAIAAKRGDQS